MTSTQIMDGFMEGIRSVAMPTRDLDSLRAEMSKRNRKRRILIQNLSRSTSRVSKSTSAKSLSASK